MMGLLDGRKIKKSVSIINDCCTPGETNAGADCSPSLIHSKGSCATCNTKGSTVPTKTVRFHLKAPWQYSFDTSPYYYCNSSDCEVVYFSDNGIQILQEEVKGSDNEDAICHCFNISRSDLKNEAEPGKLKEYVIRQTKNKNCACEINNPAGRCCLADFPK